MHVVATAGHVDHGKSTLVRALTGMEPDRWAEERRRGMTIDLGYAWTALPGGEQIAFVDVPGHQRFIANMLAGIGPAPAVLFVAAADEGWSRQSEEHLAAIHALGVRHGVLAVTRSDLARPDAAMAQARERIARSSLGAIEGVSVSGQTGAGLDELRYALGQLITKLPVPARDGPVRLWIDRSFTVRGSGTVVTGTLSAGALSVGDTLDLRGRPVTVRGLQTTGTAQQRVAAVARVAVNVRGLDRSEVTRGDVLLTPQAWHRTRTMDVRLDPAARLPSALVLHLGTAAVPVRVRPLADSFVRLTCVEALPVQAGDRAVLRDPGRESVAAGVVVLDSDPPPLTRRGAAAVRARDLAPLTGRPDAQAEVARRGAVQRDHLTRLGVPPGPVIGAREIAGWLVHDHTWTVWVTGAGKVVDEWAERNPLDPATPLAALRQALRLPDDTRVWAGVVSDAGLVHTAGRVSRPGPAADVTLAVAGLATLVERLQATPFAAPERGELDGLGVGARELAAAERAGLLSRISTDIVLLPTAADDALAVLRALRQPFTTSEARQALGTTRRVVIPLLEHLDGAGLTLRVDQTSRRVADPAAARSSATDRSDGD